MPGLSKKETARLLTHVEAQGVNVTPVKNGFMLRLPNGESTTVHLSGSDHRGPLNMRAFLKRNGIDWPNDKMNAKVSKDTIVKGDKVLNRMGMPNSLRLTSFVTAASIDEWYPARDTINKFLIYKGYESVGNTVARKFIMPSPIVTELKPVEISPEPKAIISIDKSPLPEILTKETTLEVREFLDTHDSWTVNLDILPDTISVRDMKLMFSAIGLSFEVRVWK